VSRQWQISAAELFEFARPAAWALSAIISTYVLASTRHRNFKPYWVAAWTLGTLFFPLIVLPLYLVVVIRQRRREREARQTESAAHNDEPAPYTRPAWRRSLPAFYLILVLCTVALFFYLDYTSVDAHLWRANNAKLRGPHEKVIAEYRAALRLEDNAHTHKLLAIEMAAAGRSEEALAEFRIAERMGEPDAQLPYDMALVLDSLNRSEEAMLEYNRFLSGPLCTQALPDANCATARSRLTVIMPALKQK
jgi:tetratricopeptide (TPR) repeat protein